VRLKVLFHDNCFDGAASAALFGRFYLEKVEPSARVEYLGVQHKKGDPFPPDAFDADEHACVDFRYSRSPKLGWWFDHHVSGFATPEDRVHFEGDVSGRKFYDPEARSCTKFEAGILASRFDFDAARYRELIDWADLIDGAQFPDAKTAVELAAPALRIMTWIENNKDPVLTVRLIEDFQRRPLPEIADEPYIADDLAPILERHRQAIDTIRARGREQDGVVFFDLADDGIEAHNKFIAYMQFPTCRYTVGLTRGASRVKISIGYNPWSRLPREHNIARICERYGGGGHPVVGAVSLPPDQLQRGREIAREIVAELRKPA
jgi:hypothetical protein